MPDHDLHLPQTLAAARQTGSRHYFTGNPCGQGHVAPRLTSTTKCTECLRARNANYRRNHQEEIKQYRKEYRERNRDALNLSQKLYRIENWEKISASKQRIYERNREKILQQQKEYRNNNRETVAERDREYGKYYRAVHADRRRVTTKRYRDRNPERNRLHRRNRRARQMMNGGKHCLADIRKLLSSQNHSCVYCGGDLRQMYHVDHIIPLSRGGSNGPENLQILCPRCNQRKGTMMPEEFEKILAKEVL